VVAAVYQRHERLHALRLRESLDRAVTLRDLDELAARLSLQLAESAPDAY
jgi:hypothetical protein